MQKLPKIGFVIILVGKRHDDPIAYRTENRKYRSLQMRFTVNELIFSVNFVSLRKAQVWGYVFLRSAFTFFHNLQFGLHALCQRIWKERVE